MVNFPNKKILVKLLLPGCVPSLAELGFSSEELAAAEGCREKSAIPWRGGERSSGEFPPWVQGVWKRFGKLVVIWTRIFLHSENMECQWSKKKRPQAFFWMQSCARIWDMQMWNPIYDLCANMFENSKQIHYYIYSHGWVASLPLVPLLLTPPRHSFGSFAAICLGAFSSQTAPLLEFRYWNRKENTTTWHYDYIWL